MTDLERNDAPFKEPDADVSHDGAARSGQGVKPGDTGHLGALDTENTPTRDPPPGDSGDPSGGDPTKETPGG